MPTTEEQHGRGDGELYRHIQRGAAGPASAANPTIDIDPSVTSTPRTSPVRPCRSAAGSSARPRTCWGSAASSSRISRSRYLPGARRNRTHRHESNHSRAISDRTGQHHLHRHQPLLPPGDLQKTFTFTISTASGTSTSDVKIYNIVPVNTNPTVTTTAGPLNYTALSGAQLVDPGVTVTDPDPLNITAPRFRSRRASSTGQDTLSETDLAASQCVGLYNASTGVLTITGSASQSQYQTSAGRGGLHQQRPRHEFAHDLVRGQQQLAEFERDRQQPMHENDQHSSADVSELRFQQRLGIDRHGLHRRRPQPQL